MLSTLLGIRYQCPRGCCLVSRDASVRGGWRVTLFGDGGNPITHMPAVDAAEAIELAEEVYDGVEVERYERRAA